MRTRGEALLVGDPAEQPVQLLALGRSNAAQVSSSWAEPSWPSLRPGTGTPARAVFV